MKPSLLYMYHVDNLRRKKNLTVEALCDGVCSDRQYRRLLSGEQHLSDFKVEQFCVKLGISSLDFYFSASDRERYEYQKILTLYNHLSNRDYDRFKEIDRTIHQENFVSKQNERYYQFCWSKYLYLRKEAPLDDIFKQLAMLCDYPKCVSNSAFDFVDIFALEVMADIQTKFNQTDVIDLLYRILTDLNMVYVSAESRHIFPSIYGTLAMQYSKLHRYEECLQISKKGIEYSILQSSHDALTHLYYYECHSYLVLGFREKAERSAIQCLANALSLGNRRLYDIFYDELKNDLKVEPIELFQVYKDTILK